MIRKKVLLFLAALGFLFFSCEFDSGDSSSSSGSSKTPEKDTTPLPLPVISPSAGDYADGFKEISISLDSSDVDIFYTTDGTEPSSMSSRYTGPFTIIGSKTVKAVAIKDERKSAVTAAVYNLNVGKSASQMGVIQGTLALSDSFSDDTKKQFSNSTIYIYSSGLSGIVKTAKMGESFYFDGLDTQTTYDFYFSSKEPGSIYENTLSRSLDSRGNTDEVKYTSKVISLKATVKAETGNGLHLGKVALKPTGKITGVAKKISEDGTEETDNAGITVFIPGTSYAAFTGKDGSFTMTNVPQGIHTIRAMYSGYTFCEQENISLTSLDENELVTDILNPFELYYARGTVKGTALLSNSTNGNNAENSGANAGIDIVLTDSKNAHSYTANTNIAGNWTINDVVPGTYSIEFHKDGFEGQVINDIVVTGAKITSIPTLILRENGGKISGRVNVTATSNLSGISVLAEKNAGQSSGSDVSSTSKVYYAITSEDGSFFFPSVSPGIYTVTATYAGYKSATQTDIPVSIGDEIDIGTLLISEKATYSVTGKCVLAGMENGFEGSAVLLQSSTDSTNKKSTTTNTDGVFTIPDVDSGTYTLTFSHQGFVTDNTKTVDVGIKAIAVVESVVLQTNAGTVTGSVKLESADTNEGIAILIYKENDSSKSYTTITDSTGHYAVAGVTPGTYRVQATKSGFNTGLSDPFTVSSGITSTPSDMLLSISLRSLFGTIKLEGKTDYTGVRITATKTTSTTEIYSALSNKEGFYALSGMTPGEYILSFSYEGYRSYTSSSVSLASDSSLNVDKVELVKATGKISGIVNLEGCTDHSGILVSLVGTNYTFTTAANGAYEFTVPSGNYPGGVRFEKEDYQLTAKAETIPVLTDSTYGVLTVEMKATANTLKGIIHLAGTEDYSGIKVTVDGIDSDKISFETAKDGKWQLDHVPLGYQTIRFSKVNVPDVTVEKQVIPCDFIDIGTLEMIPDSATLKGFVFLDGMSDHSGISVTISTLEKEDIVVRTTSDGAFTANNILASGSHTITFSKEGWVNQSIIIEDFEPLEIRTIGTTGGVREYVLKDTTAPAWGNTPVVINSGANYAKNTKLHVDLSPVEKGSGIEKMSVQLTRTADGQTSAIYPSTYNWQDYKIGFDYDLSELPDSFVGNGTFTLYVALKDKSGNISTVANKSITITDLITSLSGVLTGDKLHLTEENSPYLVEADCLVSEGQTLVIDPGVEVRFSGEYSITVSGGIEARGTAEKKILFTSNCVNQEYTYTTTEWGDYVDSDGNYQWGEHEVTRTEVTTVYWKGIAIKGGHLITENTYNYASGNIFEYCDFEYANLPISGSDVYINKCLFHNGSRPSLNGVIINNIFEDGLSSGGTVVNNIIKTKANMRGNCSYNNTFENLCFETDGCLCTANNFVNCSIVNSRGSSTINCNNFIDCSSPIISTEREYISGFSYNFTHNYWGSAQTDELNSKGNEQNISFISDYYDNFNYARIDYSNWATEPFENCGYSETGFVVFDYSVDDSLYPETKETTIPISMNVHYTQNSIAFMRFAQSEEELKTASWQAYSENTMFTVDKNKAIDDMVTVYAQIKDSEGNVSPVTSHNFLYDMPVISIDIEDGKQFDARSEKDLYVGYSATDKGGIRGLELYLNDTLVTDFYGNSEYDAQYDNNFKLNTMISGNYRLKVVAKDVAGNVSEKSVTFSVKRGFNLSEIENISYSTTTGQFIKDANTVHLWHLDSDGKEELGTAEISNYTHTNGGFEGAASYLYNWDGSNIPLNIDTNAFTVEYWTRGNGNIEINKESLLNIYNRYWSVTSYDIALWHTFKKADDGVDSDGLGAGSAVCIRGDDQWHYWTYVYGSTYCAIYCDGVCISYRDGFTHELYTNNNNLLIQSSGIVDEIRISNCARSADEINAYYKTAKPILDANTGSLNAIVW